MCEIQDGRTVTVYLSVATNTALRYPLNAEVVQLLSTNSPLSH